MTKTELKKYNEKKIHNLSIKLESKIVDLLSGDFVSKINNIEIDKQSKDELLFSVAEIKKLCKAQSEVLRLAFMVHFFNLSDELKERYTKALKKELCSVVYEPKETAVNISFLE